MEKMLREKEAQDKNKRKEEEKAHKKTNAWAKIMQREKEVKDEKRREKKS